MLKLDLTELKQIEFDLLVQFRNICDANGFRYSLLAGTLLGAVRHKGFIPWDDDIDVMMPREDYIKFEKYCAENETSFVLLSNKLENRYGYMFSKIYNPDTIIEELVGNRKKLKSGVFIDIFIYDGFGNTKDEAVENFNRSRFYRELLVAANWKTYKKSKTHAWYYEPARFSLFLLSRFVTYEKIIKKIENMYKGYSFDDSKYVGNLCSDKRSKSIIERSCFDSFVELEFEGETFKALAGYKKYLCDMYGDYMKLPPEAHRVTHHTFDAYRKD